MPRSDTISLLCDALELLNDRPNFGLRRDSAVTSYKLAARIEAHLKALATDAPGSAGLIARRAWIDDDIQADDDDIDIAWPGAGTRLRCRRLAAANDLAPDDPDPPDATPAGRVSGLAEDDPPIGIRSR